MTEIRLDPISTLIPLGSRSMLPTMEFASYLDEAWSRSTTTTNTATDSSRRNASGPAKASRDATGPVKRRAADRKSNRKADRGEAGADVAATQQRQTAPSESAAAPSDKATSAATPNENGGQQTKPAAAADGNARQTEASQPQAAAAEEVVSPENGATAEAGSDAALLDVPTEAVQELAGEGEMPAALDPSGGSEDAAPETSATAAETKTPAVGDASNEATASEGETGNEGENAGNGEPNTEADQEAQPEGSAEAAESTSRHGRPATAEDAGKTLEPQAADLNQEQSVDTPARAAAAAGATVDASPSAAAAVAGPAATVETIQPTASATNTNSVEPVEGVATGTTRATNGEPGARAASAGSGVPEADQAGAVDRARFVQRVAQAFQTTGDRGGTIRMRLSPPELGSLRVEITVKQGVMNARMETETDTARQLVLENLPALRERLAEQGIKVEQFQVDVSGRETGGQPNQFEDRSYSDRSDAEPRRHSTPRGASARDVESQADRRARHIGETSRLDVLI